MGTRTIERGTAGQGAAPPQGQELFARIGNFLLAHRLTPDPRNYQIAYEAIANPSGAVGREVASLIDGGVRLAADDVARLGGVAAAGDSKAQEQALLNRALSQVEGFAHTVEIAAAEANDFGRDLMRSAETMRDVGPHAGVAEIERLTGAMIERVQRAEQKLENARRETDELRSALEEARGSARTDPLTELGNRRAFDDAFAALSPNDRVTVVICDVDHFKRVNDHYGHAVGDRVLRTVARTLEEECKGLATRYGGEEFAVLYTDADSAEAKERIDAVRENLAGRRFRVRETDEPLGVISFSAGLVTGLVGEGRASLMARADAALYRAKGEGRARTIIAP